jgi:hypothetical protein
MTAVKRKHASARGSNPDVNTQPTKRRTIARSDVKPKLNSGYEYSNCVLRAERRHGVFVDATWTVSPSRRTRSMP